MDEKKRAVAGSHSRSVQPAVVHRELLAQLFKQINAECVSSIGTVERHGHDSRSRVDRVDEYQIGHESLL